MASDRKLFIKNARDLLKHSSFIDLNCGCPGNKSVGNGAGSSLLLDTDYFINFVKDITAPFEEKQISVKMRTGYDDDEKFFDYIEGLKNIPLRQLGIHGRTKVQRYDGLSDWKKIHEAAEILDYPVVASGDVTSFQSLELRAKYLSKISRIIVGRGAIRNPWIFDELKSRTNVIINIDTLIYALASLGLIQYAFKREFTKLISAVETGELSKKCGGDSEKWKRVYEVLCEKIYGKKVNTLDIEFERYTFARIKMVWSYLRSSMPEEFFEPRILRSKNFGQIEGALRDIATKLPEQITLQHNRKLDWVYTSSKKDPNTSVLL